jgi:LynF/TruF/PatF family peptide O-prenyltransferase
MHESHEKFLQHFRLFREESRELSALFEALIKRSPEAHLECSCKIKDQDVHAQRVNAWYKNGEGEESRNKIDWFLTKCSEIAPLNFGLYREMVSPDFRKDKVVYTVVGIDERKQWRDSRIKLWKIITDYETQEEKVLAFEGISPFARAMKIHKGILFGFDFSFSGKTAMKVYPVWHDFQIARNRNLLTSLLGKETADIAGQCRRISFAFTNNSSDVVLHIHAVQTNALIHHLGNETLSRTYADIGKKEVIVSISLNELQRGECKSFNIYY